MLLETWLVFVAFTAVISMTPGPNMLLALSVGIERGAVSAVWTTVGGVVSMLLLLFLSLAGLSAILAASATLFEVIKWAGVAYLCYLGIQAWRAPAVARNADSEDNKPRKSARGLFVQAFLVGISNPKAIVFFGAFVPQFLDPALPRTPQILTIAISFAVIEFTSMMTYAVLGDRLVPLFQKAGNIRLLNRITGSVLVGAGALLASTQR